MRTPYKLTKYLKSRDNILDQRPEQIVPDQMPEQSILSTTQILLWLQFVPCRLGEQEVSDVNNFT